MAALIAAQALPQCPVDDGRVRRCGCYREIAGMRVAVKDGIFLRGQKRDGDQRFDQLFGNFFSPRGGQARGGALVTLIPLSSVSAVIREVHRG